LQEVATPPCDLSAWVSRETLLKWIREELASLDWRSKAPGEAQTYQQDRHSMMLILLSFAYATGLFDSEEVARACHSDAVLTQLCENQTNAPWTKDVVEFRRKNRATLIFILKRLLSRALEEHMDLQPGELPERWKRLLEEEAIERLDIARHMDVSIIE
jgi:hypothetical protein